MGAIEYAEADLEGITIIAGQNNVGKSTVGKILYAFLHDMNLWQKTYDEICNSKIEKFLYQSSISLEDWCMEISGARRRRTNRAVQLQKDCAASEEFRVAIEDYQTVGNEEQEKGRTAIRTCLETYCRNYIGLYIKDDTEKFLKERQDWIQEWTQKAMAGISLLELDELGLQTQTIKRSFQEVFGSQYRKVGTRESSVRLKDDDKRTMTFIVSDDAEKLDNPVRTTRRIFFLESPKIYDSLSNTKFGYVQKEYLRYLMSPNVFKVGTQPSKIEPDEHTGVYDRENGNLIDISARLEQIMGGKAEFLQKVGLEFKDKGIQEPIHSVNVSSGLKSLALLEYALRIGVMEEGDILILDEPEINLHPEWQVEYARTLVDLHKTFRLNIVITTHSPYFIRAIECLTDVSGMMDCLNVYSMNRKNGKVRFENASYSEYGITALYDDLSAPLEKLEELLDKKYGEKTSL